jgi:hypothetical protein
MQIAHDSMRTILFALIPLILSIGIIPVISFAQSIDSPRKQMESGITAEDVVCKSGFTLMIRISGDAACVTPTTAKKLTNAGWGTIEKEFSSDSEITETVSTNEEEPENTGKDITVELVEDMGLKGN